MLDLKQQFFEQTKKATNILITFNPLDGGDSLAAALAVFLFCKKIGKTVEIIGNTINLERKLTFLPAFDKIGTHFNNLRQFNLALDVTGTKIEKIKYQIENNILNFTVYSHGQPLAAENLKSFNSKLKYDLIIILGAPDLESLGDLYEKNQDLFYETPIINIDHNANNENFGQINLVDITAATVAENLFDLFQSYAPDIIDADIATCILAGMILKTKSFKTNNIKPRTLTITSQLVAMGGRREEIVNRLYHYNSLERLKIWGRLLARLKSDYNGALVWSALPYSDFERTGAAADDLAEATEEIITTMSQVKLAVIFYETMADNQPLTKILVRSFDNINCLDLLRNFYPTGTKNLVQITSKKTLKETEIELTDFIKASATTWL